MSRLSVVLSALALVVAGIALALPYARQETGPALDRAVLADAVREVIAADPGIVPPPAAQSGESEVVAADPAVVGPAVREYLIANPQVLEEVVAALEARQAEAQAAQQSEAVAANRPALLRSEVAPVVGDPEGDVTLVEFFDYNCGYCKRMMPEVSELLEQDEDLRVVFKEWPVLGEESQEAAKVSVAVNRLAPEQYFEFHRNLLAHRGRVGKAEALQAAAELGLDPAEVEAAAEAEETLQALSESFQLAEAIGLRGTPSYVVGDRVFMGAAPREELSQAITETRAGDCAEC